MNNLELINMIKKVVINKSFTGNFASRRFVEKNNEYRDVIEVSDVDLSSYLLTLDKLLDEYQERYWRGFSIIDGVSFVYTKLPQCDAFGVYGFLITDVKWENNGLDFKVELDYRHRNAGENKTLNQHFENFILKELITLPNILHLLQVSAMVFAVLVVAAVEILKVVLIFALQIFKTSPRYIVACSPIVVALINCVTKCIGGLFMLIAMIFAMMFRGSRTNNPNYYKKVDRRHYYLKPAYDSDKQFFQK